jgi:hypothetical protein
MAAGQTSPAVGDWKDVDESDWKDVNEDELTKQTQVAAKAGGATLVPQTPIQQPLAGNMSKKGLFGENISPEEEQRIASRAASIQNMPSSYQAPLTNATTAIGVAELPGAVSRGSKEAGSWIASKMREPATSAQSLKGVAGTPKNILPRSMQRWTIPDWVMETVTPAGEKGTVTNPGPFNDLPKRAPVMSDEDIVNRDVSARVNMPQTTSPRPGSNRNPTWKTVVPNVTNSVSAPEAPAVSQEPPWAARAARVRANPPPAAEVPAMASETPGTGRSGRMPEPFVPIVATPEEERALEQQRRVLALRNKVAGEYHAAEGSTRNPKGLQERIARKGFRP